MLCAGVLYSSLSLAHNDTQSTRLPEASQGAFALAEAQHLPSNTISPGLLPSIPMTSAGHLPSSPRAPADVVLDVLLEDLRSAEFARQSSSAALLDSLTSLAELHQRSSSSPLLEAVNDEQTNITLVSETHSRTGMIRMQQDEKSPALRTAAKRGGEGGDEEEKDEEDKEEARQPLHEQQMSQAQHQPADAAADGQLLPESYLLSSSRNLAVSPAAQVWVVTPHLKPYDVSALCLAPSRLLHSPLCLFAVKAKAGCQCSRSGILMTCLPFTSVSNRLG